MTVLEEQEMQTEINKMIKETSHISFKEKMMNGAFFIAVGAGLVKFIELLK